MVNGFIRESLSSSLKRGRATSVELSPSIDRIESIKAAVIGAIGGSLSYLPIGTVIGVAHGFTPQWEFDSDTLALSLALFGITYRYTIRTERNDMLKQGDGKLHYSLFSFLHVKNSRMNSHLINKELLELSQ